VVLRRVLTCRIAELADLARLGLLRLDAGRA
jgi:hypothetical protein